MFLAIFSAVLLSTVLFSIPAYAQHHGGQAAPPISFGDRKVTVSTWLDPADFNPAKSSTAKLNVRFYDSNTNININEVTYRVQILSGETLLASQMFFDKDGELTVKIQPKSECTEKEVWRCTKYEGNKDPVVPSALESSSTSMPIIKGPLFDKPGKYTVKVAIIGATNAKIQTAQDIEFENNITIASQQTLSLPTLTGKTPITVRSFQDDITNLQFTESTGTISFDIPFDWTNSERASLVRVDFEIPKSFVPFQNVNSFKGMINGVPIFVKDVTFDTYTNKDTNMLYFVITGEELKTVVKKVSNERSMSVQITPDTSTVIKSSNVQFSNGYKAIVSYDPRYDSSKDISFTIAFYDSTGALAKDVRYAYSIQDSQGKEFAVNTGRGGDIIGIQVPSGVDSRLIAIPSKGDYVLQMYLVGKGLINFDQFVPASTKFSISDVKPAADVKPKTPEVKSDKDTKKDDKKKDTKKDDKKKDTKKDTKKKSTKKKPDSKTYSK